LRQSRREHVAIHCPKPSTFLIEQLTRVGVLDALQIVHMQRRCIGDLAGNQILKQWFGAKQGVLAMVLRSDLFREFKLGWGQNAALVCDDREETTHAMPPKFVDEIGKEVVWTS
jgi:hypothetical protein